MEEYRYSSMISAPDRQRVRRLSSILAPSASSLAEPPASFLTRRRVGSSATPRAAAAGQLVALALARLVSYSSISSSDPARWPTGSQVHSAASAKPFHLTWYSGRPFLPARLPRIFSTSYSSDISCVRRRRGAPRWPAFEASCT